MKKSIGIVLIYVVLAVILLPFLVTILCGGFQQEPLQEAKILYGTEDLMPLDSELEEYVVGVVAAEMPAAFPKEALKAQAVAARTYQVRHMQAADSDAVLYDVGQAYCTVQEQKEKWGKKYGEYAAKIRNAVRETVGEIMVYEGEPILAAFHAQSSGKTEDAVHVWNHSVPYLKSVDSKEDQKAPNHKTEVSFSAQEIVEKLSSLGELGCEAETLKISVLSRTEAGYVEKVQAGALQLTGRQVREALGLRSSHFTVEKKGNRFYITTFGYGHGAGMSQYGASFLAEKGMGYHEILQHYYTGITFQKMV